MAFNKTNGFVKTFFGRKRFLHAIDSNDRAERSRSERQSVNSVIQGTAADIVKRAMVAVDRLLLQDAELAGRECRLLLQVHDELVFEVPTEIVERACDRLQPLIERVQDFPIPIPVKCSVGVRWGSMSERKKK
jgi:DNA polymerase I-like protein with 3'-5' exonuclease and polymerase domains